MVKVNLDALIQREDFEVIEGSATSQFGATLQIRDLEKNSFFFPVIRKPDFQRETADWSPERIVDFIKSFIDGDLIPAIILWQAGSNIFVIDGAHRLSALIAWVHDDYGDGKISKLFFDLKISDEQLTTAEKTRVLVKKVIGTYRDIQHAIQYPDKSERMHVERAKRLSYLALQLQWVQGNAEKAEESFFKINQHAAPIDKTELRILKARKKPNAISARAILRSGKGHKYWSKFDDETREYIEELATEIDDLLFIPRLRTPIKTLDLPIAGKGYSSNALPLLLDFINIVNDVSSGSRLKEDKNGKETVSFLQKTKTILNLMTGTSPSSLGIHPIVFFYSAAGRYQPTAFLAMVFFLKELVDRNDMKNFIKIRKNFEDHFLIYKSIPNQMNVKLGSGMKGGSKRLAEYYSFIFNSLSSGEKIESLPAISKRNAKFSFINFDPQFLLTERDSFSEKVKSAAFIKEALENPIRCKICNGMIHTKSISIDHINRKRSGGKGILENAQLTHPFCNSTIKN